MNLWELCILLWYVSYLTKGAELTEENKPKYKVIRQISTDINGNVVPNDSPDAHHIEAELEYEDGRIERIYGTIVKDEQD